MTERMKHLLSSLAFLAGLLVLLVLGGGLLQTLRPDMSERDPLGSDMFDVSAGVFAEPENTIDVLFVGDSEAYSAFSPLEMWKDYGFTSHVCGGSAQPLYDCHRFILQAMETQQPRVVAVETNTLFRRTKWDDYLTTTLGSRLPLLRDHNRWKSFFEEPLDEPLYATDDFKGYYFSCGVRDGSRPGYMNDRGESLSLDRGNKRYLQRIQALCEENGAQLLLVSVPHTRDWSLAHSRCVQSWADGHGLPFLDLNLPGELDIDWSRDTRDGGDHMNHYGACKIAARLGDYLTDSFELPDHRLDPAYHSWNLDLNRYLRRTLPALEADL